MKLFWLNSCPKVTEPITVNQRSAGRSRRPAPPLDPGWRAGCWTDTLHVSEISRDEGPLGLRRADLGAESVGGCSMEPSCLLHAPALVDLL